MAKLFAVTAILSNYTTRFNPTKTMYLNPLETEDAVSVEYTDNAGVSGNIGTQIRYTGFDKTFEELIVVTEPPSTVLANINDATTDDVHMIDVTVIAQGAPVGSDYVPQSYKRQVNINVQDIWKLMVHPQVPTGGLLVLQNPVRDLQNVLRTEQAASDLFDDANA